MFWEVSNYNLWPMEKINFYILSFLLFLTSFSNSQDYEYDDYNYNEHYDYTDDYSQELNDYYGNQNLIAPPTSPIPPPFIYDILPLDILPWNTLRLKTNWCSVKISYKLKYPGKYPSLKYPRQKYPQTKISLTQNIPNKNILIPKYPM